MDPVIMAHLAEITAIPALIQTWLIRLTERDTFITVIPSMPIAVFQSLLSIPPYSIPLSFMIKYMKYSSCFKELMMTTFIYISGFVKKCNINNINLIFFFFIIQNPSRRLGEAFANLTIQLAYVFQEYDWNLIRELGSTATLFWDSPSLFNCIKSGFIAEQNNIMKLLSYVTSGLSSNTTLLQVSEAGRAFYNLTQIYKSLNATYYNNTIDKSKTAFARNFFNGMISKINSSYPFWVKNLPFIVHENILNPNFFGSYFQYILSEYNTFDPNNTQFLNDLDVKKNLF